MSRNLVFTVTERPVGGYNILIGNNITDESAEAVKYAYDLGCEIDNHSRSHGYMNEMSAEDCAAEYQYVDDKDAYFDAQNALYKKEKYSPMAGIWPLGRWTS